MPEPNTINKALIIPNTGDLVGSWGTTAVNADFQAIDGMLGGFATISLSSATTFALSVPSGSLTPGAGPTQSQNSLLKFTGTLTGNAVVQFALPGFYIVQNSCVVGGFYIQLAPSAGTGNAIGAPPGRKVHVFYDGIDMDYVDMPEVGAALDLHGATTVPPWMTACTVRPYLLKDGTVYTSSVYPALAALLGSTFGGNGINTFGVPDELNRVRLPIASGTTATRVTQAVSGINGTTMGSAGGDQNLQTHSHGITDPGHTHVPITFTILGGGVLAGGSGGASFVSSPGQLTLTNATTNITINNVGTGSSQNMPPAIISFLPLIKT